MYSVVRIFEEGGLPSIDVPEAARARVEALGEAGGLVTLLVIKEDEGALVTLQIFETLDDMRAAESAGGRDARPSPSGDEPWNVRTIAGEIVFQRGL